MMMGARAAAAGDRARMRSSVAILLLREDHALSRIVELDPQTAKLVDDAKIDGLLQIEQGVETGLLHEIREFEMQGRIPQGFQVAAVETSVRVFAHDAFEQRRYSL